MEEKDIFVNMNKYISYNEYKKYCEENNVFFNKELLEEKNNQFIEEKLKEYKDYFDHIFTDVGENINLDEEQREIILRDDDYCLVNAGAGSGKSTTMAAKVKYLVDKLNIKPEEIIMLTFTKKSSEDLDEKVNELLNLGIPVSTFHSLGMKFIRKFYPYPIKVVGQDEQTEIICEYIKELFKNKNKLKELTELFKQYGEKNYISNGFILNYNKFETFEKYFNDYKRRKYITEKRRKGGIHQYLINRLSSKKTLYTIKGEKVKSIGEVRIANFLYINGIDYYYEKTYDEKVNEDMAYNPDFTIQYHGRKIYIEYFGLSSCYNEKNELNRKEILKYNFKRKIKEKFQMESHDEFINLDYKVPDEDFIKTLEKQLISKNIEFNRRSDKEIFDRIIDNNLNAEFFKFTNLAINFIDIIKNMLLDDENYMFSKIKEQIKKEKLKYFYYSQNEDKEKACRIKALEYLEEIYMYYQEYLTRNHMVDYSDMINLTYRQIIKEVKNKYNELNYKYIIVDEYQDITFQRFLFVKRLIEYFNAKLITVGDDWQSIYAFAGSRLELFNRFKELFIDSRDDMFLSTTYRYGQELADITSKFVLENDKQSRKEIRAIKNLKHPIEICEYEIYEEYRKINELIHELYRENPNNKILILARTNDCLNKLSRSQFFTKGIGDVLICKELPEAKIEALTMHRSKGLTSDQVIIFGLRNRLFPSEGKSSHWIFDYFKLDSITEHIPFAEERRLFYVALTRTRNKVYLVVPSSIKNKSQFINEIEKIMSEA